MVDFDCRSQLSGWPSGLRRQTQGFNLALHSVSMVESSGPRMWAWVRIPLLTKYFFETAD